MKTLATATKPDSNKRLELSKDLIRKLNETKIDSAASFVSLDPEP